ncbi:PREDICTED: uncharacterized protein LOC105949227 [Erythranthe guttata]|uniref:uncharacterized protein LOC105949227 n=1 Tax=Erythranthe guttata TaxID=4155 RepID=UPI00064D8128|nr:PREDICTED: uncharacterized protein LOC105949227 [Erythranthe guttata]|eukprot:XP_012827976.1 PREDICTED: uncharacterized protein LOC105949227 [Erythranthe guttata]
MGKNRSAEGSKKRRHTPSASPAEKKSRKSSKKVRPTAVEVSPVPTVTDLDPISTPMASPSPSLKTSDVPDHVDTGVADLDGDSLSATRQDDLDLPSDPEIAPHNVVFPAQLRRSNRKHEGPSVFIPPSESEGYQFSSSEPIPEDDPSRSESSDSSVGSQLSAGNCFSSLFYFSLAKENWNSMSKRACSPERVLSRAVLPLSEIFRLLKSQGLLGTIVSAQPFERSVIVEFYANLSDRFSVVGSRGYGKVYVRGSFYSVTPAPINDFYKCPNEVSSKPSVSKDTLAFVLTAKVLKKWPGPKSALHVSKLTQLYSVLFKIGISNWFPTTHNATLNPTQAEFLWCITHDHKINIGDLIFNQIGVLANSRTEREHLPFPSLIYQLLIKQGLPTCDATLLDPPGRPITIHGKVISEHFADMPVVNPSVVQPVPSAKKAPIVSASIPPPVDVDQLLRTLAHSGQKGGVATTRTPAASTKTKDKGKEKASLLTPPPHISRDEDDLDVISLLFVSLMPILLTVGNFYVATATVLTGEFLLKLDSDQIYAKGGDYWRQISTDKEIRLTWEVKISERFVPMFILEI